MQPRLKEAEFFQLNSETPNPELSSTQKVGCQPARSSRRSNVLKVAMTFPTKRAAAKKRPASEPLAQLKPECDSGEEEEVEEENFIVKRALNIKENKEMVSCFSTSLSLTATCACRSTPAASFVFQLAKLMAELNKVPGLFPRRMAMSASTTVMTQKWLKYLL